MILPRVWYQPHDASPGEPNPDRRTDLRMDTPPDDGAAAPPSAPAPGFSQDLAAAHPWLWTALSGHAWITSLAGGTLPEEAAVRWCQQRRILVAHQQRALMSLRASGPPEPLARWISYLDDDIIFQHRMLAGIAELLHVPANAGETKTCLGYGSYLRLRAREGLPGGLTALYSAHCAYQHAWHAVPRSATIGTPWHAWQQTWTGAEFRKTLNGFAEHLNAQVTPGSQAQEQNLLGICETVLEWEADFLDMCYGPVRVPEVS
jgi:thiaminase